MIGEYVDELFRAGGAAGWRGRSTPDARAELIELGPAVVPCLIEHLRRIDRSDLSYDGWDDEVCLFVLAQVDDQRGKQYVVDCAVRLMDFPENETEEGDFTLGCAALEAMGASSDARLHHLLVEWVLRIDTAYSGPDVWNLRWLLDPARPFLDERARPVLLQLLNHPNTQDVGPSVRQALAAIDGRGVG